MKYKLEKTNMLIPKIVDSNGFSVARAPDSSTRSNDHMRRIMACLKALDNFTTEEIEANSFVCQ